MYSVTCFYHSYAVGFSQCWCCVTGSFFHDWTVKYVRHNTRMYIDLVILKEPLDEGERGEWKNWLKIQKIKIMVSSPTTSWQIDGETLETVTDFIFLDSKIIVDGDCSHEIKRHLFLRGKAMTNLDSMLQSRDITLLTKVIQSKLWFFLWSCMDVRVGP